jgi:predicted nucleotidyltransferase component of viral defense system
MLSFRTIVPDTLELLKRLTQEPFLKDCRLVGGTALALQYGHRSSIDLDFFGTFDIDGDEMFEILSSYGNIERLQTSKIVRVFTINGVKVDVVNYSRYPWLEEPVEEDGLRLASPKDIAAMKIGAIEGRGSRKDFVDMYFLLQHFSMEEILDFYAKKYPNYSLYRALMSLTYFVDAEKFDMPTMFVDFDWEQCKSFILNKVKEYESRY